MKKELENLYYKLEILKEAKEKNNDKIDTFKDKNTKAKINCDRLNSKINKLEDKKLKLKESPKELKIAKKRGIMCSLFPMGLLTLMAMVLLLLKIPVGELLVSLGVIGIPLTAIASKIAFKDYFEIKNFMKNNNEKEIEEEINENKDDIVLNKKNILRNNRMIDLVNLEQENIENAIKAIYAKILKEESLKNEVINIILNKEETNKVIDDVFTKSFNKKKVLK